MNTARTHTCELSSCDLMNITGEIEEICKEGTKLINVKWRY